jgi:hypothetical protein
MVVNQPGSQGAVLENGQMWEEIELLEHHARFSSR